MTKSLPALLPTALDNFGMPDKRQLHRSVVVSATITKIVAIDDAVVAFHRKMVHHGICFRYEFALAVAADKKAFAAFLQDDRIKGLARPPKIASDTLRSLFSATYADQKKASKYFKRIEPFWAKRRPVKAVLSFLQKEGLSDPPIRAVPAQMPSIAGALSTAAKRPNPGEKLSAASQGSQSHKASSINKDNPPGGSIVGWPDKARVGRVYKMTAKITENVGEATIFELLEVPELLG